MRYFIISRNPAREMADWWAAAFAAKDTCTNLFAKAFLDNAESSGWHHGEEQCEATLSEESFTYFEGWCLKVHPWFIRDEQRAVLHRKR